jgi:hypothetical protein
VFGIFASPFSYFGPAVPIYGAIFAWAYLAAAARLGIVDLFVCEISTLCAFGEDLVVGAVEWKVGQVPEAGSGVRAAAAARSG